MAHYRTTRIVPIILTILIIIVAVVALVALARALFFSGAPVATQVDAGKVALLETSDGHSVSMTVRGPIVANENFRSYAITVSPNARVIKTYTGYLDTILQEKTLGNNTPAYAEFVNALDRAKMADGSEVPGGQDVLGICATGRLYQFAILKDGESVETLWTSTCSGSKGTLDANAQQLSQLFIAQIPDASSMIRSLSL